MGVANSPWQPVAVLRTAVRLQSTGVAPRMSSTEGLLSYSQGFSGTSGVQVAGREHDSASISATPVMSPTVDSDLSDPARVSYSSFSCFLAY